MATSASSRTSSPWVCHLATDWRDCGCAAAMPRRSLPAWRRCVRVAAAALSRFFAPAVGVPEDPATGSAAAALAGWLARHFGADGPQHWQILQGGEIGRPSTIELDYEQTGSSATRVRVGGCAVMLAHGTQAP